MSAVADYNSTRILKSGSTEGRFTGSLQVKLLFLLIPLDVPLPPQSRYIQCLAPPNLMKQNPTVRKPYSFAQLFPITVHSGSRIHRIINRKTAYSHAQHRQNNKRHPTPPHEPPHCHRSVSLWHTGPHSLTLPHETEYLRRRDLWPFSLITSIEPTGRQSRRVSSRRFLRAVFGTWLFVLRKVCIEDAKSEVESEDIIYVLVSFQTLSVWSVF